VKGYVYRSLGQGREREGKGKAVIKKHRFFEFHLQLLMLQRKRRKPRKNYQVIKIKPSEAILLSSLFSVGLFKESLEKRSLLL